MPRTTKKLKTEDFINEENKEIKKTTTKKSSVASSKDTKKRSNKKTTQKVTATEKVSTKSTTPSPILEYYDLPYRYNQTVVKILAQTPTTLFVYWDISDIDRINFIEKYGEDFFNKTKPILLIYNKTKNYYLEVEINDFANSWYLHMQ